MDKGVIALLIPVFGVIGVFVMIIMVRRFEFLEKSKMIDKGLDPSTMKPAKSVPGWSAARFAFTAIGLGLGVLVASFLERSNMDGDVAYPAMLLIFGGLGLFAGTLYTKNQEKKELD